MKFVKTKIMRMKIMASRAHVSLSERIPRAEFRKIKIVYRRRFGKETRYEKLLGRTRPRAEMCF